MPEDLWTVESEHREGGVLKTLKFIRALEERDWDRFNYYARRIRRLVGPLLDALDIHETALASLSSYHPTDPLLPNLRGLHIDLIKPLKSPWIPILLNSTVTGVSIYAQTERPNELPALLSAVAHRCADLRHLEFKISFEMGVDMPPVYDLALRELICAFQHLETFSIPGSLTATPDMIRHLGSLPGLRDCGIISIPSNLAMLDIQSLFAARHDLFPTLQYFHFEVPSLDMAADVIESLQRPYLKHMAMAIESGDTEPSSSLARLTGLFLHPCRASSLTVLYLRGPQVDGTADAFRDAFRSLFPLQALQTLIIHFPCASELDDDWLAEAATAWPHLESLEIWHGAVPKMTLAGLIPLIRHCPGLHDLSIQVIAKPFDRDLLKDGTCNKNIRYLDLKGSPIEAPVEVFQCLLQMFPYWKRLSRGATFHSVREDRAWEKVRSLLAESVESEEDEW